MGQQTYDPAKVTANVAGINVTQFAKGTFITVEYESDAFSDEGGAGGEVGRVRSADERGTIKFTIMAASPSNDALSALAALDRLTGKGVGPAQVKDVTGTSLHSSESAWVKRIPSKPYSTEPGDTVEWEIRCAKLKHNVGGTVSA